MNVDVRLKSYMLNDARGLMLTRKVVSLPDTFPFRRLKHEIRRAFSLPHELALEMFLDNCVQVSEHNISKVIQGTRIAIQFNLDE